MKKFVQNCKKESPDDFIKEKTIPVLQGLGVLRHTSPRKIAPQTLLPQNTSLPCTSEYRGFLPNATFGAWKKSHYPKIALAKFLANESTNKINSP